MPSFDIVHRLHCPEKEPKVASEIEPIRVLTNLADRERLLHAISCFPASIEVVVRLEVSVEGVVQDGLLIEHRDRFTEPSFLDELFFSGPPVEGPRQSSR